VETTATVTIKATVTTELRLMDWWQRRSDGGIFDMANSQVLAYLFVQTDVLDVPATNPDASRSS
jgi:hypothetical protein